MVCGIIEKSRCEKISQVQHRVLLLCIYYGSRILPISAPMRKSTLFIYHLSINAEAKPHAQITLRDSRVLFFIFIFYYLFFLDETNVAWRSLPQRPPMAIRRHFCRCVEGFDVFAVFGVFSHPSNQSGFAPFCGSGGREGGAGFGSPTLYALTRGPFRAKRTRCLAGKACFLEIE